MSFGSSLMHENVDTKKKKKVFVSSIEFKPHPSKRWINFSIFKSNYSINDSTVNGATKPMAFKW